MQRVGRCPPPWGFPHPSSVAVILSACEGSALYAMLFPAAVSRSDLRILSTALSAFRASAFSKHLRARGLRNSLSVTSERARCRGAFAHGATMCVPLQRLCLIRQSWHTIWTFLDKACILRPQEREVPEHCLEQVSSDAAWLPCPVGPTIRRRRSVKERRRGGESDVHGPF